MNQCTYILKRGLLQGHLCMQNNCHHMPMYCVINILPYKYIYMFNNSITNKLRRVDVDGEKIIQDKYIKYINLYMYMKNNLGDINYDIFTNLITYYIDNKI